MRLEQEAAAFLKAHYKNTHPSVRTEIKLNPISRKIKLKNCHSPLEFQTPRGNGSRITLRARCKNPNWQIFIVSEIKQYGPAVISRISLPKKTALTPQNIVTQEVELTNIRTNHFQQSADILGWITKRSLPSGTVLTASMLKAPLAVSKGNAVIIEAKRKSVTIRASGTALENGSIGQQIKVMNDRSGNIIKATVIESGLVRAP
ncbi:flagellar basal body P-ring formation chaperone FlgA [uncultured Neptuniibacter sp.]|uniref:flagellar basal body P-ring formation chaperone FlgA n=1 Tax=uncultured Neptuniibacter sp. TaxID=502143 RepID=UPI00262E62C8|nr:flagellar basal body P-ring formation chaperone FlgA [uncultured Neptuniibacter sp.]